MVCEVANPRQSTDVKVAVDKHVDKSRIALFYLFGIYWWPRIRNIYYWEFFVRALVNIRIAQRKSYNPKSFLSVHLLWYLSRNFCNLAAAEFAENQ